MDGRPTGEANVDFSTHQEAVEGMKKHKTNMRKWLFLEYYTISITGLYMNQKKKLAITLRKIND